MATITEDYVSFETAKLLKEKGFNGECVAYYSIYKDNNASLHRWRNRQNYVNVKNDGYTIVPTLQMAMKWLRKIHNLIIYVKLVNDGDLYHDAWGFVIYNKFTNEYIKSDKLCFKYEEACEEAMLYCLKNLI